MTHERTARLALICSERSLVRSITRAVSSVLVTNPNLETLKEGGDAKLLIVAEPGLSELCRSVRHVRKLGYPRFLLAVASDDDPAAIARVVSAGADDYVSVPARIEELPYRAAVLLCRTSEFVIRAPTGSAEAFVESGTSTPLASDVRLDPNLRTARVEGQFVALTAREFQLLRYLCARPSTWVSAVELMAEVCGCSAQQDSALVRVHICALRKKLGSSQRLLASHRTFGYCWRGSLCDCCSATFTQS